MEPDNTLQSECKLCGATFRVDYNDSLFFPRLWRRKHWMLRQKKFLNHLNAEHGYNWTFWRAIKRSTFLLGTLKDLARDLLWLALLPIAIVGVVLQWVVETAYDKLG